MFNRDGLAGPLNPSNPSHQLEPLEPRVLLTTLVGGDVFDYVDARGNTIRVSLEGDIIVELIGADIDNTDNSLILGDLPGYIYTSQLGRTGAVNGGLGGADGLELLDGISVTDPINGAPGSAVGPDDSLNIKAIGIHPDTGNTWAMNRVTLTPQGQDEEITIVQLIEFNLGTGVGTVRHSLVIPGIIVDGVETVPVADIVAGAFDIRPGREDYFYFVLQLGDNQGYQLAAVNVDTGVLEDTRRTLVSASNATLNHTVTGITFEQSGGSYNLLVAGNGTATIDGEANVVVGTIRRSVGGDDFFGNTGFTTARVTYKAGQVTSITGISFLEDNTAASDRYIYATTDLGLLRVDLTTGFSQLLGPTVDPDDTRDVQRGAALSDLTYNAQIINPFTGELGVLIAVDIDTDDLVYLDDRPRFSEADLFAIYVAQSSENARISIALADPVDPDSPSAARAMRPFTGTMGFIRINATTVVLAPLGSGSVLIGAQTEELSDAISAEEGYLFYSATLGQAIGVRPAGLDDLPDSGGNLSAGIVVAPSFVEYMNTNATSWAQRLMGQNLDVISALAINRFGRIVVVDTDQTNTAGNVVLGDVIAQLDPDTGIANPLTLVNIIDGGGNLTGTTGLSYGFADLTQINGESDEELYAIIDNRFGIINTTTGFFTEIAADITGLPGDLGANTVVKSMAFAPGGANNRQDLYILADPDGTDDDEISVLYKVTYTVNAGQINAITSIDEVGVGIQHTVDLGDMTFDSIGRLLVVDKTNGRMVQLNTTTGALSALAESPIGSLRATVGGLAYDLDRDRILVADNATSLTVIENESNGVESAALLVVREGPAAQSIGDILIGGTVTGQVNLSGSIDTFYAGWLITGNGSANLNDNFYVAGDIRNLISGTFIGTSDAEVAESGKYTSNTQIQIDGRLGTISGENSGAFRLNVLNQDNGIGLTAADLNQEEIEFRIKDTSPALLDAFGLAFGLGKLYNGSTFFNDTLETAEILGSIRTGVDGENDVIRLDGTLHNSEDLGDVVDYYSIALLAGQIVSVRLENITNGLGIIDPDGRIIASTFSSEAVTDTITFTATRPGLYTIGVGQFHESILVFPGNIDYTLHVEGMGTTAIGGISFNENFNYTTEYAALPDDAFFDIWNGREAIQAFGGDIGGIRLGGALTFNNKGDADTTSYRDIYVDAGNLRSVSAASIGSGSGFGKGMTAYLNQGDVGLVQATAGILNFDTSYIGGNIQFIEGAADVFVALYVDGGIGNIHAGSMSTSIATGVSFIQVNYDNLGQDGIIDLIDVAGDFGTFPSGGVQITTGSGGNVRYIRVGGTVYQDSQFAGGDAGQFVGQSLSVVDDSGANVRMEATGDGELTVTTYGIRGSGGSVIVKVESSTGFAASSSTGGNLRPAEISELIINGQGNSLLVDPLRNSVTLDNRGIDSVTPVNVVINGNSTLDVFSIVGTQIDNIVNNTNGELVNINAWSVGFIYAGGSLGLAKKNNDTAVLSRNIIYDTFPFSNQRNAITLGEVASIRSGQSIGNVIVDAVAFGIAGSTGTIGNIHANCDNINIAGVFEGIAGPIFSSGDMYYINIGEGIADTGTGYFADAGIFSSGKIVRIINQGLGSDIRGTVASVTGIGDILLTNGGSIIHSIVAVVTSLDQTSPLSSFGLVVFDDGYIDRIQLTGNGGIIGSTFVANRVGDISVRGGFGIINSNFYTSASGSYDSFYADGYGFRGVTISSGRQAGTITAGERSDEDLAISSYTASVRQSEFDPDNAYTVNDLFTALDSMGLNPDYTYTAGVIYDLDAQGTQSLGTVRGFRLDSSDFNYANNIDAFYIDEDIFNTNVTTGTTKTINTGSVRQRGDILDSTFIIAGNIGSIQVYGNIERTLIESNNNGTLNTLNIRKFMGAGGDLIDSTITITGRVNTISIDGDIDGSYSPDRSSIEILSGSQGTYAVNRFTLGGNLFGSLDFQDDVASIVVAGSLGQNGDRLVVNGSLRSLIVGGDRTILGVELGLDLFVLGDLGSLTVNGIITGDVTVQGTLGRLMATADAGQAGGDVISGDISVTESIRSIMTRDGNISGDIYAGRDITMLSITGGSFTDTASATSIYGKIANFTVSGDMDGSISVENGDLSSLRVGGDMGALALINALSIRTLTVTGHIEGGAAIIADRIITSITAGYIGDGATAATIIAGGVSSISTRGVRGVNDGDLYANLFLGDSGRASRIMAAGNFGGTSSIDGDVMVMVRGDIDMDMTAGEQLVVNGNLTTLSVTGDLSGAIVVKGSARSIIAGSITDAVITTGLDLSSLTSRGTVTNSLIQVGLWAGSDQSYTSVDGQQDLGEQARRATLGRFTADRVDNSIIASAGDLTSVTIRNEALDSSFSSGLSVGSLAINARMGGNDDADQLRSQDGRELLTGSMRMFSAGTLTNSYVTAGVDAGATGDFATPSVLLNNAFRPQVDGGGYSNIGMVRGVANAGTRIVADSGVDRDMTTGNAVVTGNVTYNIADLEGGNALPASVGIATQGNPLTYTANGLTITITVRGPGSVDARDISLADGVLDGLVITGTTSATTIDITTAVPGTVDIGRILTEDDTALRSFSFDGGIVGDDTAEVDVWFDGGITSLSLAGFGTPDSIDRVTGSIGGDVATFNLGDQSQGVLRISGAVRTFNITTGDGNALQINQRLYAGRSFDSLTFDGANVFAHEAGTIYTIDPLNNGAIAGVAVTDATLGTGLTLSGMDIQTGTNNVYAVANVFNQNPTVEVGPITQDLVSLAVRDSDGAIFAIRHDADNNVDQLVRINPLTAGITVIGSLLDIFGNTYGSNTGTQVMSLAFSGDTLLALLTDRDGAAGGAVTPGDDAVIASIATTANQLGFVRVVTPNGNQALPPVTLGTNGGENYTGMAVNGSGHIYAVRDNNTIVRIDPTNGTDVTTTVIPGVSLVGIGFDADDNLIGLDSITDQVMLIDLAGPLATPLQQGAIADGLTAFAIGKTVTNGGYQVYAYDDINDGGVPGDERIFYTNPGTTPTLGLVDPATGEFTQLRALTIDEFGTPLDDQVVSIAYDAANNKVKVLTQDGRLITYNNNGSLDQTTDSFSVYSGGASALTSIDYSSDGRLIALSTTRQLLFIDTDQESVSILTEPGSIQGDLTGFAIDEVTGVSLVFNNDNQQVATLAGLTQQALGGITANTISRLTLGDGYSNRIAAMGNLDMISINGDFDGTISTGGNVRSLTASGGEFSGSIYAAGDISRASLRDADLTEDALFFAGNKLSLDVARGANFDGLLDGTIVAGNLVNLRHTGTMTSNAQIFGEREAASISIGGDFAGNMFLASATRSLIINGQLLSGSSVVVRGDAPTITLRDGAQANTLLAADGSVRSLTVGGTFSGVIGVGLGLQRGSFDNINAGLVSIGLDTLSFMARGDVTSSVLSFGTQLGGDYIYNTDDDVITGGIVRTVSISGHYRDSITAAGVLPSFNLGGFIPGVTSNLAFLGNASAPSVVNRDSAEAGGLVRTSIDSFSIRGEISSSNVPAGRISGLVAADNIGRVTTGQTGNILQQRVYTDPFGAVEIIDEIQLSSLSFELILSEELTTSTIIPSQDLDDDQLIGVGDVFGALIIYDGNGDVVDNATLTYSTRVINNVQRSVIRVTAPTAFAGGSYSYDYFTGFVPQDFMAQFPVLMDRSGARSAMVNFNNDPFGTQIQ